MALVNVTFRRRNLVQLHWSFALVFKLKIVLQLMHIFAAILKLILNYLTRNVTC